MSLKIKDLENLCQSLTEEELSCIVGGGDYVENLLRELLRQELSGEGGEEGKDAVAVAAEDASRQSSSGLKARSSAHVGV